MKEDVSLISLHPAVQHFVFSVIKGISIRKFNYEEKIVIDADLVPKVSGGPMKSSTDTVVNDSNPTAPSLVTPKPIVFRPTPPRIVNPRVNIPNVRPRVNQNTIPPQINQQVTAPVQPVLPQVETVPAVPAGNVEKYGKIIPLLNDPSVSGIECMGADKELMIIRMGQKQKTRVVLSADEIRTILDEVANEARIPLLDGVFRAAVKGFSISAVISEMIGSRFVIKKVGSY